MLDVAREKGASHFVLLSAICVQKPTLEFQKAKLKLEEALASAGDITYSIVRPTAFFKSIAGQIELVKQGKPYVMFGDGQLASCKPISEADLASFISDCVVEKDKVNQVRGYGVRGRIKPRLYGLKEWREKGQGWSAGREFREEEGEKEDGLRLACFTRSCPRNKIISITPTFPGPSNRRPRQGVQR